MESEYWLQTYLVDLRFEDIDFAHGLCQKCKRLKEVTKENWIGHTLGRSDDDIAGTALDWNSQRTRRAGDDVEKDCRQGNESIRKTMVGSQDPHTEPRTMATFRKHSMLPRGIRNR